MKLGSEVFYIDGNKFYVSAMEVGYEKKYTNVEVCQQRYLSGNAYDETGNHGKAWFRNVSKTNYQKALRMFNLLKDETL